MEASTAYRRRDTVARMPAPLAKGLIISISLLVAAGAAAYENPQIRQWVEEARRKIAQALHELGDEFAPNAAERRRHAHRAAPSDASTREDESADAVERRRQARQEILERGRLMDERRKATTSEENTRGITSFNEIVDADGNLKAQANPASAEATGNDPQADTHGLRHRAVADPFTDEHSIERDAEKALPDIPEVAPPLPPKPAAYQQALAIDTSDHVSSHPSESHLLDLTPTTSNFSEFDRPVSEHSIEQRTPESEHLEDSAPSGTVSYASVNEWAQSQSALQSFHSAGASPAPEPSTHTEPVALLEGSGVLDASTSTISSQDATRSGQDTPVLIPSSPNMSVSSSVERVSHAGEDDARQSDADVEDVSDLGDGMSTPSTWTEVGSQVSAE